MVGIRTHIVLSGILVFLASTAFADLKPSVESTRLISAKSVDASPINTTSSAIHPGQSTMAVPAPRKPSQWQREDRRKARDLLSQNQYDVLVVPFQETDHAYALDPTARSLMTLSLAQHISRSTELSVADPVLVARAFGNTARSIDEFAIQEMSVALGVSHVVVGKTHQNLNGEWTLTVANRLFGVENADDRDQPSFVKANIPFSGANPAYFSFLSMRDSIVKKLLPTAPATKNTKEQQQSLPKELASLVADEKYPTIQLLQLLAILHPERNIDRVRDSLLERSLVLTENLNAQDPEVRVLKARALLLLGRRQAALGLLEGATSVDAELLQEYANSNYTPVEHLPLSTSVSTLMINILQQRLGTRYRAKPDLVRLEQLQERHNGLAELISLAYQDNYVWRNQSNETLIKALKKTYPDITFSRKAIYARQLLSPSTSVEYKVTNSILEHLHKQVEYSGNGVATVSIETHAQDYIDLVRSMAVNNVIQSIYHAFQTQGKRENGYWLVNSFLPLLKDQPEFTLMSALTTLRFSEEHQGTERASLRSTALELARDGVAWSGRFDQRNRWLRSIENDMLSELAPVENIVYEKFMFVTDRPTNSTHYIVGNDPKLEVDCAHNNVYSFYCFEYAYKHAGHKGNKAANRSALISELQSRFKGHPKRLELLANYQESVGNTSSAAKVYQDEVNNQSRNWRAYSNLGYSFVEKSLYDDALKIVLQYPGFSQSGVTDDVTLSAHAYEFGNQFYWTGAYQNAKPLYKISADLNTGSSASLASAIRLAIVNEDYEQAIEGTFYRARRYQSPYAIRDLAGLAVITGNVDWASEMIDSQHDSLKHPEVWIGALMAHRALGKGNQAILNWALSRAKGAEDHEITALALRQFFLSATLDRDIPKSLSVDLAKSDTRPSLRMPSENNPVAIRNTLKPDFYFGPPRVKIEPGSAIKSRLVYGAEALDALSNKDYAAAFKLLDEASHIYPLNELLPYYALTAAKTGNTDRINAYIGNDQRLQPRKNIHNLRNSNYAFDISLAEAFLNSQAGDHERALASLAAANHQTKHTETRLLPTRYQLLETARLIYEDTSEDSYRQFASELAKNFSVIEPYQAYTHSFVAMLSDDRNERIVALSKVISLDLNSRSLAVSNPSEFTEAKKLAAYGYPRKSEQQTGF